MSFALLFSGQGTQHAGMLRWLADSPRVQATNAALGVPDWRGLFDEPASAARNDNAQVMLTGIALAAWAQLATMLPAPAAVAGYSVGELPAFAAAGVFEFPAALALAKARAAAMDRCAALAPGGLLAVSGIPLGKVDAFLAASGARQGVSIAIRNAPSMVVLGGPDAALQDALQQLTARGARCVRLNVEVASHTPSMQPASSAFAAALALQALRAPRIPLFSCTADRVFGGDAAAAALATQLSATLLWDDCLDGVHARHVDCVLEIGPGAALASMWNQRFPDTPARSADEFEDLRAVAAWIGKQG